MTFAERLGRNIRRERQNAGLTQRYVGQQAGLSGAAICQYESGRKVPRLETFARLVITLGVAPGDLLPGLEWDPSEGRRAPNVWAPESENPCVGHLSDLPDP